MANLGEITEIVNASELTLEVGADTYILLQNLRIHVGRTEFRDPTTDGGVIYTYGKGDHFFTATLLVSTPELSTINTLNELDADGDMTPTLWLIHANDVSGSDKYFQATGVLRDYDVVKDVEGKVKIDIFVRITGDTITISNTAP